MRRWILSLAALALLCLCVRSAAADDATPKKTTEEKIADAQSTADDAKVRGDSAWMLVSTGLVLFMVPGLALFYGGMVRRKNVLGTMMHSMVCLGLIGIQWLLFGYSIAFGASNGGWFGWSADYLGLQGVLPSDKFPGTNIPTYLHCMYQGMFAIITPALISGAIAERIKFLPYCLFILLWSVLVYDPLAHWVWAVDAKGDPAGFLLKDGALDFAGGTVVHIAAGFSSLAAILVLRRRRGYPEHAMHPNSMVLTLTGAGILWFGWFGFNGGSALGSTGQAVSALTASQVAAAMAAVTWMVVEWIHKGKPTGLGLASGLVAGLVAITPASGYVGPMAGLFIGLAAGLVCYLAVSLKPLLKYDDSLDAFGVHGVGGFLGAILTGFFASALVVNAGAGNPVNKDVGKLQLDLPKEVGDLKLDDEKVTGEKDQKLRTQIVSAPTKNRLDQITVQIKAAVIAAGYAFLMSLVLFTLLDKTIGFISATRDEEEGLDRAEHGEVGFDLSPALEMVPEGPTHEPRPAMIPPNGKKHFTVVVDGTDTSDLLKAWSDFCGGGKEQPPAEFRSVYPFVTTVRGNRFHFRGGDPIGMRETMQKLFQSKVGASVKARVEE